MKKVGRGFIYEIMMRRAQGILLRKEYPFQWVRSFDQSKLEKR